MLSPRQEQYHDIDNNSFSQNQDFTSQHTNEVEYNLGLHKYIQRQNQESQNRYKSIQNTLSALIVFTFFITLFDFDKYLSQRYIPLDHQYQSFVNLYNKGQKELEIYNLQELRDHIFDVFQNTSQINEKMFQDIKMDEMKFGLIFYTEELDEKTSLTIKINQDYDIDNISKVLKLPFQMNKLVDFKNYLVANPNFRIIMKNINYCVIKIDVQVCVENDVTLQYANQLEYYQVKFIQTIREQYDKLDENQDQKNKPKNNYRVEFHYSEYFLVLLTLFSLLINLKQYFLVVKEKKVQKYFGLELILRQIKKPKNENERVGFFYSVIVIRNLCYLSFSFSYFLFIQIQYLNLYNLKSAAFFLGIISCIPIIYAQQRLRIVLDVLLDGYTKLSVLLPSFIGVSLAFSFSGFLLFSKSPFFKSVKESFLIIFSLMVGDSVLDTYREIESYAWMSFFFMLFVHLVFGIVIRTIFVTIMTDSYFTVLDQIQKKQKIEYKKSLQQKALTQGASSINLESLRYLAEDHIDEDTLFELIDQKKNQLKGQRNQMMQKELEIYQDMKTVVKSARKSKLQNKCNIINLYLDFLIQNIKQEQENVNKYKEMIQLKYLIDILLIII